MGVYTFPLLGTQAPCGYVLPSSTDYLILLHSNWCKYAGYFCGTSPVDSRRRIAASRGFFSFGADKTRTSGSGSRGMLTNVFSGLAEQIIVDAMRVERGAGML